jgi:hypothetical protein
MTDRCNGADDDRDIRFSAREASIETGLSVRTIRMLARKGKLEYFIGDNASAKKIWITESALEKLREAYTLQARDGKTICSAAVRSRKIASEKKHAAGKLVTKRDAAFLLDCSERGIDYQVKVRKLSRIKLGYRTVVYRLRDVIALRRKRIRFGRKIGTWTGQDALESLRRTLHANAGS